MFARRTLSLAVAALALGAAACLPASSPQLSAAPDAGVPLEAAILPPHYGQVPLHLNKPAYVALFEVIPGRGVSLLYPQSGSGFVQVREAWVPLRYNPQRWMYASNVYSSFNRIGDYGTGYDDYAGYARGAAYGGAYDGSLHPVQQAPRYLFLVASEDPMAIERFQGEIGAIRDYLGRAQYTSMRPEETMEELAFAILPYMSEERWVTDVYVDWGSDWGSAAGYGATSAYTSLQRITCSNGSIMYAPWRNGWGFEYLPCVPLQWVGSPGTG
ncbi:MAG TPA: hypothetical protein VFX39_04930, partial [Gemmatimonadaceae bacterium]|nr:hypothetical protein [Gemmatimonadaceae bacterium]